MVAATFFEQAWDWTPKGAKMTVMDKVEFRYMNGPPPPPFKIRVKDTRKLSFLCRSQNNF